MTQRTDTNQPSAVEIATHEVLRDLSRSITEAYARNRLDQKTAHGFAYTEPEFRRMLALFLFDSSIQDWAERLGIADPSDPHEGGHRA